MSACRYCGGNAYGFGEIHMAGCPMYKATFATSHETQKWPDPSELPTRIHHASIYDEGKFDGQYYLKERILEALNRGGIEELRKLVEGWVRK